MTGIAAEKRIAMTRRDTLADGNNNVCVHWTLFKLASAGDCMY